MSFVTLCSIAHPEQRHRADQEGSRGINGRCTHSGQAERNASQHCQQHAITADTIGKRSTHGPQKTAKQNHDDGEIAGLTLVR